MVKRAWESARHSPSGEVVCFRSIDAGTARGQSGRRSRALPFDPNSRRSAVRNRFCAKLRVSSFYRRLFFGARRMRAAPPTSSNSNYCLRFGTLQRRMASAPFELEFRRQFRPSPGLHDLMHACGAHVAPRRLHTSHLSRRQATESNGTIPDTSNKISYR